MKKYLFIISMIVLLSLGTLYYVTQPSEFEEFMSNFDEDIEFSEYHLDYIYVILNEDGYETRQRFATDYYYAHYYRLDDDMFNIYIKEVNSNCYAVIVITFVYEGKGYIGNGQHVNTRDCVVIDDVDMSSFDLEEVMLYAKERFEIE